jgi:hypothetical protein
MTYALGGQSKPLSHLLRGSAYALHELYGVSTIDAQARRAHYELLGSHAVSLRQVMLRQRLAALRRQWNSETRYSSSLAKKKEHPAYRSIVALGDEAIPLILEFLEKDPDFLVMALHDITQENPVAPEHHGRVPALIEDWLRWGAEHGYR